MKLNYESKGEISLEDFIMAAVQEIVATKGRMFAIVYATPNGDGSGATVKIAEMGLTCKQAADISTAFREISDHIHERDCKPIQDRIMAELQARGIPAVPLDPGDPAFGQKLADLLGAWGDHDAVDLAEIDFSKLPGE